LLVFLRLKSASRPWPDRLVQQDAAVTGGEHDLHLAGGRLARVEHGDGLARRLLGAWNSGE
jgi:hypothetical protein